MPEENVFSSLYLPLPSPDAGKGEAGSSKQVTVESKPPTENPDKEEKLHHYTPDDKKKEVLRILRWPEWAYYEILEVPEDATEDDIKKAFHKKSKLTHTDQNNDVQANEVSQRVNAAYENLSNKDNRKKYNAYRKKLKKRGQLVQQEFDESFEQGAYDDDSDDESEEDDIPMSKEKQAIIDEMGPFVKKILNSCDKDATAKLVELNQKIINQNKSEGIFATSHCPPIDYFIKTGKNRKRLMKTIQKPPQSDKDIEEIEEAEKGLGDLHMELEKRMEDLELPKDWTFDLPPERGAAPRMDKGKGRADGQASSGAKDKKHFDKKPAVGGEAPPPKAKGKGNEKPGSLFGNDPDIFGNRTSVFGKHKPGSSYNGPPLFGNTPATLGNEYDIFGRLSTPFKPVSIFEKPTSTSGGFGGSGGSSSAFRSALSAGGNGAKSQDPDSMDVAYEWRPGETTRGEKILAYRPKRGWAQPKGTSEMVETESANDFVIERKGEPNPIEIVNRSRVGLMAVNAYLALPEEEKNSITNIDQWYDRTDGPYIRDIKGFARKFSEAAGGNLPWGVALIDYDGEDRIVNRSALRKALGGLADDLINDFLLRVGEEPDDPKYVRLQMRLEDTRNQLRLEDRMSKLRLGNGRQISKRIAERILLDYSSDSDSDLFVSGSDTKASTSKRPRIRHDKSRLLTGGHTERPKVRINDDPMQLDHRRRTKERSRDDPHGEPHDQDPLGSREVVTRDEMQNMINQMMQQMMTQFMQMRLPAAPGH